MSVAIINKPINIFYNEISDQGRIEKLVNALAGKSVYINSHHTTIFEDEILLLDDPKEESNISILTYRNNDAEEFEKLLSNKSPDTYIIVLRLESGKFDFVTEGVFHINASFLPDELLSQWISKKVSFFQGFSEKSANLYSRAMHWSENHHDSSLLLEKNELFDVIYWLEQSVESHKELRNLSLKINYISASRQKYFPFADAYLHCGQGFKSIGVPVLQTLRNNGLEIIAGNYISPKVYEQKFNEQEIKRSNNFIYVYSPNSVQSNECKRAVSYARSLNKRIITLVEPDMKDFQMPPEIDQDNIVHVPTDWMYHIEFVKVIEAKIKLNKEFVQEHTLHLIDAFEWIKHKKNYKFLIQDTDEVQKAGDWLVKGEESNLAPKVSPLQKLYIERSIAAHSLRRNIKLGGIIFAILLLVLGALFFFFISNNNDQSSWIKEIDSNSKMVNTALNQNDIIQTWSELSLETSKVTPFLKVFYSKERFTRIIGGTNKEIKSIVKKIGNELFLVSYGLSWFEMIDSNGYLIKRFEVDDHKIFKADFIPEKELIVATGTKSKISIWTTDGQLKKIIDPGKNELCRDFVFLPSKQKIAFLIGDKTIKITDYQLNTLDEFDAQSQVIKIQATEEEAELGILLSQAYIYYNLELRDYSEKNALPIYTRDAVFTEDKQLLLADNDKVYQSVKGEWQLIELPFKVNGLVKSKAGSIFLLNKEQGVYLLNNNSTIHKVFINKAAYDYNSIYYNDQTLITIGSFKSGENFVLISPDSIPEFYTDRIKLYSTPIKVYRKGYEVFLIDNQKVSKQEKGKAGPTWEFFTENKISAYSFNPEEKTIIIGDIEGNLIKIDANGKILNQWKIFTTSITGIEIDNINNYIFCADKDGIVVCLTESWERKFEHQRHLGEVAYLKLSNNNNYLLSAGEDRQMIIWDQYGKQYNKLKGASSTVKSADFSKSNSFLISLGKRGDYTLWDIEGNVIRYERTDPIMQNAFFHSNGEFIVLSGKDQLMAIDAKGSALFNVVLPENMILHDAVENSQGDIDLLYSNSENNTYYSAVLPFSKTSMEQQFTVVQQL